MLPLTLTVAGLTKLPAAAAQLAVAIKAAPCTVVAFEGEMGAGKTTLIRALAAALGVADDVSSPTFSLVNEYRDEANRPIYHFDFYRIDTPEEALRMGAAEYFDSGYLCMVEWPARVAPLLPVPYLEVHISVINSDTRRIVVSIHN
jgi:tRNA threonylcarbamoyladenosine biosynthesis protein TsaE